jgi:hypothetical protein
MDSPLKYDQDISEEFGIDDSKNEILDPVYKIAYVRSQLEEISKFLYRERVELILGQTQADSKDEMIAAKGASQVTEHRNNIKQVVKSINVLKELLNELQAIQPE